MLHLESFLFTAEVILPVAMLLTLGYILKKRAFIDDSFVKIASKMVFNLTLPALLFLAISGSTINPVDHLGFILFVLLATTITCVISWVWSRIGRMDGPDGRAFVQAAFRSNLGIIGIALAIYAFGDKGKEIGALVLAVGIPAYNLLSVIVLSSGQGVRWGNQLLLIVQNPLIASIGVAAALRWLQVSIPVPVVSFMSSLGDMTLALALIAVGGSLDLQAFKKANWITLQIVGLKLIFLPAIVSVSAFVLGFSGLELGVITLMMASPTAAAAFVMAQSMNANHVLTANAIAVTTLASLFTMGGVVYVLRVMSLV